MVALPRVIWENGAGEGWDLRNGRGPHRPGKDERSGPDIERAVRGRSTEGGSLARGCGDGDEDREGWAGLTSLERIRYRTMRPRSTARVWLSKSGELMPGGEQFVSEKSPTVEGREPDQDTLRERSYRSRRGG